MIARAEQSERARAQALREQNDRRVEANRQTAAGIVRVLPARVKAAVEDVAPGWRTRSIQLARLVTTGDTMLPRGTKPQEGTVAHFVLDLLAAEGLDGRVWYDWDTTVPSLMFRVVHPNRPRPRPIR